MIRKVVSNARYSASPAGAELIYTVELGSGGSDARQAQYSVVFKQSSGANTEFYVQALCS